MASDLEGEAQNASTALLRLGKAEGLFSELAEIVENRGIGKLYSEDDMKKALAYQEEQVRAEVNDESAEFFDVDGEPIWHSIALFCQRNIDRLTRDWDKQFVNDLVGYTASKDPTPKQAPFLLGIFMKLGGQCASGIKAKYCRR